MPVYRAGLFRGCRPLLFPLGFVFPRESTSLWGFWPLRGTRSGQALSTPRELDEPFCRTFMRGFPQAGVMAPAASLPNGGCTDGLLAVLIRHRTRPGRDMGDCGLVVMVRQENYWGVQVVPYGFEGYGLAG